MDPISLVTVALSSKILEEISSRLTQNAVSRLNELRQVVWDKVQANPQVTKAVLDADNDPSQRNLAQLALLVQVEMIKDPEFARAIQEVAHEIQEVAHEIQVTTQQYQVIGRDTSKVNLINPESDDRPYNSTKGALKLQAEKLMFEGSFEASFFEDKQQSFWQNGDRAIAFASGGAFLGGLIAQVPGAIVGALAGAIFGWFEKDKPANSSENSR